MRGKDSEMPYTRFAVDGVVYDVYRHYDLLYNPRWLDFIEELSYCQQYNTAPPFSERSPKWIEAEQYFSRVTNELEIQYKERNPNG